MANVQMIISPGEGQTLQELAQELLALAGDSPHDVEYSPRAGGFFVPEKLAAAYALQAEDNGATVQAADGVREARPAAARTRAAGKPAAKRASRAKSSTGKAKNGGDGAAAAKPQEEGGGNA